jgi:thiol-disulfide isomerase/thioredoxin
MRSLLPAFASVRRIGRGIALAAALAAGGWGVGYAVTPSEILVAQSGRSHRVPTRALLDWPLEDLRTGARVELPASKTPILFIVFSASDCSSCLMETAQWNQLASLYKGRLEVRGIVINSSREEAREYTVGFEAAFPLYYGADPGHDRWAPLEGLTPLKVLVNRHHQPVLAEAGGAPSNAFALRVSSVLNGRR